FLCRAAGALGGSGRLAFFSTPLAPCSLLLRAFRVPLRAWTVGEHNPLASRRRPRGFAAAAVGSARRLRPFGRALPTATAAKPHGLRLAGSGLPTRAGPERPRPWLHGFTAGWLAAWLSRRAIIVIAAATRHQYR